MSILWLWTKPDFEDFPHIEIDDSDTCVLVGDGVYAAYHSKQKPHCSLLALEKDLQTRQLSFTPAISDEAWLELILKHDKIVSL